MQLFVASFEYPPECLERCLVVTWLVPRETDAVSAHVLCTPYKYAPVCHFKQSQKHSVDVCLAEKCHLHFRQNDRDILRSTAVTQG